MEKNARGGFVGRNERRFATCLFRSYSDCCSRACRHSHSSSSAMRSATPPPPLQSIDHTITPLLSLERLCVCARTSAQMQRQARQPASVAAFWPERFCCCQLLLLRSKNGPLTLAYRPFPTCATYQRQEEWSSCRPCSQTTTRAAAPEPDGTKGAGTRCDGRPWTVRSRVRGSSVESIPFWTGRRGFPNHATRQQTLLINP